MLTNEQLNARKKGIGGSDAAAAIGLSRYKSPLKLYNEKLGLESSNIENDAMRFGQILEPIILEEYAKRTGYSVEKPTQTFKHGQYDFILGNVDGLCSSEKIIVECKNCNARTAINWGENGTDEMPTEYLIQSAHYAMVLDAKQVDVAVYFGGGDFRIYHYFRNDKLEKSILDNELEFWNSVQTKTPPTAKTYHEVLEKYNHVLPEAIVVMPCAQEYVYLTLKRVKEQMALLQEQEDALKAKLGEIIGSNEVLIDIEGKKLATWKIQSANRFNSTKFKEEHADLYTQYQQQAESRVMRIY